MLFSLSLSAIDVSEKPRQVAACKNLNLIKDEFFTTQEKRPRGVHLLPFEEWWVVIEAMPLVKGGGQNTG